MLFGGLIQFTHRLAVFRQTKSRSVQDARSGFFCQDRLPMVCGSTQITGLLQQGAHGNADGGGADGLGAVKGNKRGNADRQSRLPGGTGQQNKLKRAEKIAHDDSGDAGQCGKNNGVKLVFPVLIGQIANDGRHGQERPEIAACGAGKRRHAGYPACEDRQAAQPQHQIDQHGDSAFFPPQHNTGEHYRERAERNGYRADGHGDRGENTQNCRKDGTLRHGLQAMPGEDFACHKIHLPVIMTRRGRIVNKNSKNPCGSKTCHV